MNVGGSPLRLLDDHTWTAVLLIGMGFGLVACLAMGIEGRFERGLSVTAIPLVFGVTAVSLSRHGSRSPGAVLVANVLLMAWAIGLSAYDAAMLWSGSLHPFVATGLVMSILLQAAVLVVALESVRRLRRVDRLRGAVGGTA